MKEGTPERYREATLEKAVEERTREILSNLKVIGFKAGGAMHLDYETMDGKRFYYIMFITGKGDGEPDPSRQELIEEFELDYKSSLVKINGIGRDLVRRVYEYKASDPTVHTLIEERVCEFLVNKIKSETIAGLGNKG